MNYCKRCNVEIEEGNILCKQCEKHQFHFGTTIENNSVQEEIPVEENIVEDVENVPDEQENIENDILIEEELREETDYEKYKKINYIQDKPEEYASVELPGGKELTEENSIVEIKKIFSEFKKSFLGKTYVRREKFSREDLISSIVILGSIVGIGVLIFVSANIIHEVVDKKTEINEEIIEVYIDENAPYYHHKSCNHLVKDKRYIKLEEEIAKDLGYIPCKNTRD